MHTSKWLILVLLFLCFFCGIEIKAETINIWAGSPVEGFGDVASNLVMARRLKKLLPGATINIVGKKNLAAPRLGILLGGDKFDEKAAVQTVDGIGFYMDKPFPKADYLFEFSITTYSDQTIPDELLKHAGAVVRFHEYGRGHPIDKQTLPPITRMEGDSPANFEIRTGGGESGLGYYTTPGIAEAPLDLVKVNEILAQKVGRPIDPERAVLGFAYADKKIASDNYLSAVVQAMNQGKWSGKEVVIVAKHPVPQGLKLPPNLKVIRFDTMPLSLSESLIAHSNMPILVTGDVSLTFAIDYAKPFFYERQEWKKIAITALGNSLGLEGEENRGKLAVILNTGEGLAPIRDTAAVMMDDDFLKQFQRSLSRVREHSLAGTVAKMVNTIKAPKTSRGLKRFGDAIYDFMKKIIPAPALTPSTEKPLNAAAVYGLFDALDVPKRTIAGISPKIQSAVVERAKLALGGSTEKARAQAAAVLYVLSPDDRAMAEDVLTQIVLHGSDNNVRRSVLRWIRDLKFSNDELEEGLGFLVNSRDPLIKSEAKRTLETIAANKAAALKALADSCTPPPPKDPPHSPF